MVPLRLNIAVTDVLPDRVTVHVALVPVQPPPVQPLNIDPVAAAAVSVTALPVGKAAVQVVPQLIPVGELVTVPDPLPDS